MGELSFDDQGLGKSKGKSNPVCRLLSQTHAKPIIGFYSLLVRKAFAINAFQPDFSPALLSKGCPWSEEEHKAFLRGLESLGKVCGAFPI